MTYPDRKNALAMLAEWQERHDAAQAMMDGIKHSVGLDPNGPLFESTWRMFGEYTNALSMALGDLGNTWLPWYHMENNMGRRGMDAGYDGKTKPIKTLRDLYRLVAEERKRSAQDKTP